MILALKIFQGCLFFGSIAGGKNKGIFIKSLIGNGTNSSLPLGQQIDNWLVCPLLVVFDKLSTNTVFPLEKQEGCHEYLLPKFYL